MGNRHWNNSDDELLRTLYHEKPLEEVAERLRRTVTAIKQRAMALKLYRKGSVAAFQRPLLNLSEYGIGFLSALIDGEGWIGWSDKKHTRAAVVVVNTNVPILQQAQRLVGGLGSLGVRKKAHANYKQAYHWQVKDGDAVQLLRAISGALIIKKVKAERVLQRVKKLASL